jgi:hypothetical protein
MRGYVQGDANISISSAQPLASRKTALASFIRGGEGLPFARAAKAELNELEKG